MGGKTVGHAAYWGVVDTLVRQAGQFLVTIVLARFIAPEEFGLVALLSAFTAVGILFVEGGLNYALIQTEGHTEEDENTVFWFNVVAGVVVASAIAWLGPRLADYFGQPELVFLAYAMSINVLVTAFGVIHVTLLSKKMDFFVQAKVSLISVIAGGFVAIVAAINGHGVWALVYQIVVTSLVGVIAVWWWHGWRPKLLFSFERLKRLFGFGGRVLLTHVINVVGSRMYTVVLAKMHSVYDVGVYSRAVSARDFVQTALSTGFNRVTFSVYTSRVNDAEQLRETVKNSLRFVMAFNLPVMAALFATAEQLIPLLFGPAWMGAVPLVKILSIVGMLWPLHQVNLNALIAQGAGGEYLKIEVVKKIILICAVFFSARYGVHAVAYASLASSVVGLYINAYYSKKYLDYSLLEQLRGVVMFVLSAVVSIVLVSYITGLCPVDCSDVLTLVMKLLIGGVSYISLICLLGEWDFVIRNTRKVLLRS